jgi:hypothetical protein
MNQPTHITAYVHAQESYEPGQYIFAVWNIDMSSCGYIPIAKVEIPVPLVSEESIRARHLALLRLKRDEVYEEARKKAAELDEQIAKIECLSYNPTPQEPV